MEGVTNEDGGLDKLWFGIGNTVVKLSEKLRRIQVGYLNVYIAMAAIAILLIYVLIML